MSRPETVLIVGSARSGTSWIAEILRHGGRRYIFEPFNQTKIPGNFGHYMEYVGKGDVREADDHIRDILSGNLSHKWCDQFNLPGSPNNGILIKDIRSLLFTGWLLREFPELKVIYVIRHGMAVAESRARIGWHVYLSDFMEQKALMDDYLKPYLGLMIDAIDWPPWKRHLLVWCIENYVAIKEIESNSKRVDIRYFEVAVVYPNHEFYEMSKFMDNSLPENLDFKLPSTQSHIKNNEDYVNGWKQKFSAGEIREGIELMNEFGIFKHE